MMAATTWLTAFEAQEKGFCDEIEDPVRLTASASALAVLAKYKGTPGALVASIKRSQTAPPRATNATPVAADGVVSHIIMACNQRGIPHLLESVLASGGALSMTHAMVRIEAADQIAGMCRAAKLMDMAPAFVASGLGIEQVRTRLFDKVVQDAAGEISNLQRPAPAADATLDQAATDIYDKRRATASPNLEG